MGRLKSFIFLCLCFMYYLCEKYYKFITIQDYISGASLIAQLVKNPPAMQETPV